MITPEALGKRYKATWVDGHDVKHGVSGPVTEISDDSIVVKGVRVPLEQAKVEEVTR